VDAAPTTTADSADSAPAAGGDDNGVSDKYQELVDRVTALEAKHEAAFAPKQDDEQTDLEQAQDSEKVAQETLDSAKAQAAEMIREATERVSGQAMGAGLAAGNGMAPASGAAPEGALATPQAEAEGEAEEEAAEGAAEGAAGEGAAAAEGAEPVAGAAEGGAEGGAEGALPVAGPAVPGEVAGPIEPLVPEVRDVHVKLSDLVVVPELKGGEFDDPTDCNQLKEGQVFAVTPKEDGQFHIGDESDVQTDPRRVLYESVGTSDNLATDQQVLDNAAEALEDSHDRLHEARVKANQACSGPLCPFGNP
jgi:hypothetical protein